MIELRQGDMREVLAAMDPASVDAVVTDPPYHLTSIVKRFGAKGAAAAQHGTDGAFARASRGFMGKEWDGGDIAFRAETWALVLRVLKPGGHLLAFNHSRTWHRMAVAIEDAGFEMRDSVFWFYGSGMPKSHSVSAGIDKLRHDREDVLAVTGWVAAMRGRARLRNADIDAAFGFNGMAGHWTTQGSQASIPTLEQVPQLLAVLGVAEEEVPDHIRRLLVELNGRKGEPGEAWQAAEVVEEFEAAAGVRRWSARYEGGEAAAGARRAANSEAARQWEGWGSALKPAVEPIVLARKPLAASSIARQVLATGTGAINIDACRIAGGGPVKPRGSSNLDTNKAEGWTRPWMEDRDKVARSEAAAIGRAEELGRWPANLIHDGSREVVSRFPAAGAGSAARFFYCAKADAGDRRGSDHPTVKPQDLMRWLVRLVTPPGGLVLDPFAGSGATAWAAAAQGFRALLIEREDEYAEHIRRLIADAEGRPEPAPAAEGEVEQLSLFAGGAA